MHASAMPEEAKSHGDAVVIGEAESVWPEVLRDFKKGKLKPFYPANKSSLEMVATPLLRTFGRASAGINSGLSIPHAAVPYNCTFCSVQAILWSEDSFPVLSTMWVPRCGSQFPKRCI